MCIIPKNIAGRKILRVRYPKCDCFCEWQEQMSITTDMEIIISTDDNPDRGQEGDGSPDDPFFGHYNTYF
jgi:hypothetical protein